MAMNAEHMAQEGSLGAVSSACPGSGNWTVAEFLKRLPSVVATLELCVLGAQQVSHVASVLGEGRDAHGFSRPTFTHRLISLTGVSLGRFLARIAGLCFARWG